MTTTQSWFKEPQLPSLQLVAFTNRNAISDISETRKQKLVQLSLQSLVKKLKVHSELTDIEWLVLLNKEKELAELDTLEQTEIGHLVWKHTLKTPSLFQKIIKKLMLDYEFGYEHFPKAFKDTLLRQVFKPAGDLSKLQLSWVRQLILNDKKQCAAISLKHNLTPKEFSIKIGFNSEAKYLKELILQASHVISEAPSIQEQHWWVNCQDEVKAANTVTMLEQLLGKLTVLENDGPLDKWLTKYYLPDSRYTEFYKLNEEARQQLLILYNVTTYEEVKNIFKLLRDTSIDQSLTEWEARNLNSRIDFWSDYSDSFKRVRFILTARAYELLKYRVHIDTDRIAVMTDNDRNNRSEICIFEFERFFIVERFRNEFDMGVFAKTALLERQLFSQPNFDAMNIIPLVPDGMHDHKNDYQYFVKEALCSIYGIKANRGSRVAIWRRPHKEREQTRNQMLLKRYVNGINHFNI